MRIGGWWRLWIVITLLWVVGVALALYGNRPTRDSVDSSVGSICSLDGPVSETMAPRVLQVPKFLRQLANATTDEQRKALAKHINQIRVDLSQAQGKLTPYSVFRVTDPDGRHRAISAPFAATNEEVKEQAEYEVYATNSWAKFGAYCEQTLIDHGAGIEFPTRWKSWAIGLAAGCVSVPLFLLLSGLLIRWIWRGFRLNKKEKPQ